MRLRDISKGKPPLSPLLSGGNATYNCGGSSDSKLTTALGDKSPPLTRGGREGLAFILYNKNLTSWARENRNHPTAAESKLWYQLLRGRNLSNYKFIRQKPIATYIVDFYCAELHLAIEVDGDSHAETIIYDDERTNTLNSLGITVVRYSNYDILNNLQGVYADLISRIEAMKGSA